MQYVNALNDLATAMLSGVLNSLFVVAAMALFVWVSLRFARGLNASTRHAVWWALLLAAVAVAPVRYLVQEWEVLQEPVPVAVGNSELTSLRPTYEAREAAPAASQSPVPDAGYDGASADRTVSLSAGYIPLALVFFTFAAFGVQCYRLLLSYRHLRRLKRAGIAPSRQLQGNFDEWLLGCGVGRPVRLLVSDEIASPLAVGFRYPAVIVPRSVVEKLSSDDLDHMLLHELAHLARRDDWTNLIARAAWGLLWFHPVAAWVLRRIDEEREIACDDWVVSMTGDAKPYARSLSRLVELRLVQSRELLATGIGGRGSKLGDRIERLLSTGCRFESGTSFVRVGVTTALLLGIAAAGVRAPAWIALAQTETVAPPLPPAPAAAPNPAPALAVEDVMPHRNAEPHPVLTSKPKPFVPPPPPAAAAPAPEMTPLPHAPLPHTPIPHPPAPHAHIGPVHFAYAAQAAPPPPPAPAAKAGPAPGPAANQSSGGSFLKALADAGYKDLSVDEIIELRNHGISAEYLAGINKSGWGKLSVREVVRLRNHGVKPQFVREVHSLGFGPFTIEEIVDLSNHGARLELFHALKEAGFTRVNSREIVEACNHGLHSRHLREAEKYGSQLSLRQIIRLKQAGVI